MRCPSCHCRLEPGARYCGGCGEPLGDAPAPLELVLGDGRRIPLVNELTIGRVKGCSVVLRGDDAVSRRHARIGADALLSDENSRNGTWVDGVRVTEPVALHDGAVIHVGDQDLRVERRPGKADTSITSVVQPGSSLEASGPPPAGSAILRPRVIEGYTLVETADRWVIRNDQTGRYFQLGDDDEVALLRMLDGDHSLHDLAAEAEARWGRRGGRRLGQMMSGLAVHGLLAGIDAEGAAPAAQPGRLRRLLRPREFVLAGFGPWIRTVYQRGGWLVLTDTAKTLFAAIALAGVAAFVLLVVLGDARPLTVADRLSVGAAVFVLGRLAIGGLHEIAHGLVMASYARQVSRAGLKVIVVVPYLFVDTSEAWFESSRRRIAVSLAGPVSDFVLGGAFALIAVFGGDGVVRDVGFNLALAAYVGALFNLNPAVDRDGYHVLVDAVGIPGLRRRARERIARRLAGDRREGGSRAVALYAGFTLVWTVVGAAIVMGFALRYRDLVRDHLGATGTTVVFVALAIGLLLPAVWSLGGPLLTRLRQRAPEPAAAAK